MINGKTYAWEDISVKLPYGTLIKFDSIDYNDSKEKEAIYGKGSNPVGEGRGNYSGEAKVKMLREEFNEFTAYAKKKSTTLYGLPPFQITVAYANEDEPITVDILPACSINKTTTGAKQGDKSVSVEINMTLLQPIIYNGLAAN